MSKSPIVSPLSVLILLIKEIQRRLLSFKKSIPVLKNLTQNALYKDLLKVQALASLIYLFISLCFIFQSPMSYGQKSSTSPSSDPTETATSEDANSERITDPEFIREKQRIQQEFFEASEAALTTELQPIAEELKTFLPEALAHLNEKISMNGRQEVVKWAKSYENEHKRLTFAQSGESKINWVSTEDKRAEISTEHKEALILKITLHSAPHLAFLVYDPREISPETNPHLRKYIARIHTERKQAVILLGIRDGELAVASGESVPSLKVLNDMGKWWKQRWIAVWNPPKLHDLSLGIVAGTANAISAGIATRLQSLLNQSTLMEGLQTDPKEIGYLFNEPITLEALSAQGPQTDPKLMGLSFAFALFFGYFNNTYAEWTTKGHVVAQYIKNYTSTLPYNLLALTFVDGASINPLTPQGRVGWATAIGVGVLSNILKVPMNKAWRIRNHKRVNTGKYSIPIPFSNKRIGILPKSRTEMQVFRQIFEVPKLLALLGFGVYSVQFLNATIDGGDLLFLASGLAWYRYALSQAEKHDHRDQVQLRRAWDNIVSPVRETLSILRDFLAKGPRAGAARAWLAGEYIDTEITIPAINKVKDVCQIAFGKKPKPSQRLSKENIDNILSQLTPL